MLRPSTCVCGLTETALQTTEPDEKSLELLVVGLFLREETKRWLGVTEDGVRSDWVLPRNDAKELIREAEAQAIFALLLLLWSTLSFSLRVSLPKKVSRRPLTGRISYGLAATNLCVPRMGLFAIVDFFS